VDGNDVGSGRKCRRLLWPIEKKYGNRVSWADLIVQMGPIYVNPKG
jgi:catalase-peroxidase